MFTLIFNHITYIYKQFFCFVFVFVLGGGAECFNCLHEAQMIKLLFYRMDN